MLRGPQHGDTRTLARARLLSPTAAPSVTNGVALPRTCFDTPPHTCLLTHTTSRALLHARSHAHRCSLSRTRSDTRSHTHRLSLLTPAPRPASPTHALSRSLAHTDTRSLTLAASLTRTLPGGAGPGRARQRQWQRRARPLRRPAVCSGRRGRCSRAVASEGARAQGRREAGGGEGGGARARATATPAARAEAGAERQGRRRLRGRRGKRRHRWLALSLRQPPARAPEFVDGAERRPLRRGRGAGAGASR